MSAGFVLLFALEGSPVLTAREAVERAVSRAPAIERASADAERGEARARAAKGRLGPVLFLDLAALATNDPVDVFSLTLKQERFIPAEFFASDANNPPALKDWSGAVVAFWALDVFGNSRGALRAAERSRDAGTAGLVRRKDEVAFETLAAFIRARRAEEALAIADERLADAAKDAELAGLMKEQGLVTAADPARARAAEAEVRAERAGLIADRAKARAALARLAGEDALTSPLGEIPTPPEVSAPAGNERSDIVAARSLSEAGHEAESSARAARWPSLFLQGRYEMHAPRFAGSYGGAGSVVLGVRLPLFASGSIDASIAEAGAEARAAEAAAREIAAAAEEEARSASASYVAARERRRALEQGVEAARVAREIQRARYEEGAGRLADLLDARLAEARVRLGASAARADESLAGWGLRLATGQPLDVDAAEVKK